MWLRLKLNHKKLVGPITMTAIFCLLDYCYNRTKRTASHYNSRRYKTKHGVSVQKTLNITQTQHISSCWQINKLHNKAQKLGYKSWLIHLTITLIISQLKHLTLIQHSKWTTPCLKKLCKIVFVKTSSKNMKPCLRLQGNMSLYRVWRG